MAYNQELAHRIRPHLQPFAEFIEEKKMFGGLSFMYKGKMSVGIVKDDLMVRVVSDKFDETMSLPHVQPMAFTGKPMKNFVQVKPAGLQTEEQLSHWVSLGIEHAEARQ
jgi:TfoX/Sxy family transcriptional regulator of competence genes